MLAGDSTLNNNGFKRRNGGVVFILSMMGELVELEFCTKDLKI